MRGVFSNLRRIKRWTWIGGMLLFLFGVGAGAALATYEPFKSPERGKLIRTGLQRFTNPLLACEIGEKDEFTEFRPIEKAFRNYSDEQKKLGSVTDASVYLRTLNSGRWIGIDEDKEYEPANLMKVGLMMTYLKLAADSPALLADRVTYTGDTGGSERNIDAAHDLESGKTYTIEELIENLIIYSNNTPLALLVNHISERAFHDAYADLHLPFPEEGPGGTPLHVSPKSYSLVFRALYGATYIDRKASEQALELLSRTEFNAGLRAGVPKETVVAHKFGAADITMPAGPSAGAAGHELHDCGIIYYPKHPYLLCVMTRGLDTNKLAAAIAHVSHLAYSVINERFKR